MKPSTFRKKLNQIKKDWQDGDKLTLDEYEREIDKLKARYIKELQRETTSSNKAEKLPS